jgi:hypothetical protein
MEKLNESYVCSVIKPILMVLLVVLLLPAVARAECKEFKIVEYEDRVEAVCVGEPLTEAEKKAIQDEDKRRTAEDQRQRAAEQKRERDEAATASKSKAQAQAQAQAQADAAKATERNKKNSQQVTPPKPVEKNSILKQSPYLK